ncbi:MAG: hypothetical protein ACLVAT_11125 [Lachnospiraceae bacterium]
MSEIWMRGNGPLEGEVKVQGSKNAALPMMAAAVLHEGKDRASQLSPDCRCV